MHNPNTTSQGDKIHPPKHKPQGFKAQSQPPKKKHPVSGKGKKGKVKKPSGPISKVLDYELNEQDVVVLSPGYRMGVNLQTYFTGEPRVMNQDTKGTVNRILEPKTPQRAYDTSVNITVELQDLLHDMIEMLIDDSAQVTITSAQSVNKIIFSIMVPPREMGKIIGKQGVIIKSLTTIFKAMGSKYEKVVELELVEPRDAEGSK